MAVQTASGSKLYLSNAVTTVSTQVAFEALTWVEIGEIENLGDIGLEWSAITAATLSDRLERTWKGTEKASTMPLQLLMDPSDTGQTLLRGAAYESDDEYGVKVTLNDAGSGSPSSPTTFYFRGRVMSYTRQIGTTENVVRATSNVAVNTRPIEVAAV